MRFFQLDVFADAPFAGNPLAVFPEAAELKTEQMQRIAREMNLSETSFVTSVARESYDVRIFTVAEELPFAGHPTIGTAWLLRHLGTISGDSVVQRSAAGETPIRFEDETTWFERTGQAGVDVADRDIASTRKLADALGVAEDDIGLEAREIGRPGRLSPAMSNAGLDQLMVPVRDLPVLERLAPRRDLLIEAAGAGAYCFTALRAGAMRARGFFPGVGVDEDPATGSACAALGIYLADRLDAIELEVLQGVEMGRPSRIILRATRGRVSVGGRSELIVEGRLERLP